MQFLAYKEATISDSTLLDAFVRSRLVELVVARGDTVAEVAGSVSCYSF